MNISHRDITEYAHRFGFEDVRFARADDTLRATDGRDVCLRTLMPDASCILVLFKRYRPAAPPPPDTVAISAYYIASHDAYTAAKALAAGLRARGAQAALLTTVSAQQAALRTCGFIGDNGFFYHPDFGSLVCIQTILTDAADPLPKQDGRAECTHCGACADACPSGGVRNLSRCLRAHINSVVPEYLRGDIYQLIGCERCQTACPLNSDEASAAIFYPIADLLMGKHIKALKALAGSNFVRQRRMISQAVLYTAATGAFRHLPRLLELADTAPEPIKTHARWAADMLTKGTFNDD